MSKPEGMEEYDGYNMPEPKQMTKEELEIAEKRIQKLGERIEKANQSNGID